MTAQNVEESRDAVREMRVVVAPHEDHLHLKPMLTIRHDARDDFDRGRESALPSEAMPEVVS